MEYSGLTSQKARELQIKYGFNEIPQKASNVFVKGLRKLVSPISVMLFAASLLSLLAHKVFDFNFILLLLFLNISISLWQENKADKAIKKLNERLAQKVWVLRDGQWLEIESRLLVVGDITKLSSGEVVTADGEIIDADHVSVNEAAVSGESLPKEKGARDSLFSGSFLVTGIAVVKITATGKNTSFGKTITSVERVRRQSLLEKDILSISKFLTILSLTAVLALTAFFLIKKVQLLELLTLDLSLVIAGIPISLPTVMTLIIEFGVIALSKKSVIVRRLSALEDLSNVNFLLTDKTGTLTQNKITIQKVSPYGKFLKEDVLSLASIASSFDQSNPIDEAIITELKEQGIHWPVFKKEDFVPADSERKRSTATVKVGKEKKVISCGAPQIIAALCKLKDAEKARFLAEVESLAQQGYRTIAVSISNKAERDMDLAGLIALSDTLRPEAPNIINFMESGGIKVSMVTGDNRAIAAQIANKLSLGGRIIAKDELNKVEWDKIDASFFTNAGAFAEILPEDKFKLVLQAKKFFTVAANGDGVNDLPAVKVADVGMAVKNAVEALKATADIVLLSSGIDVIKDSIIESRKIFERVYTYSLYRISESYRLIVTIAILGIIYRVYPLTPLQIIIVALLNDIPIISLAFDKVKVAARPAKINTKRRFVLSSLFGIVGVLNSLILFFIMKNILKLDWDMIQTIYFLKLTVSGHMLIFVAHTKERWYKFLPSREVILATGTTQFAATIMAFFGILMPSHIPLLWIFVVWIWSFFWMQVAEVAKDIQNSFIKN